jgi:hypothetical protein
VSYVTGLPSSWNFSLWMLWFSLSESKYGRFKTDVTIAFYLITFNDSDILKQLMLMVITVNCWYTLTQELIIPLCSQDHLKHLEKRGVTWFYKFRAEIQVFMGFGNMKDNNHLIALCYVKTDHWNF